MSKYIMKVKGNYYFWVEIDDIFNGIIINLRVNKEEIKIYS